MRMQSKKEEEEAAQRSNGLEEQLAAMQEEHQSALEKQRARADEERRAALADGAAVAPDAADEQGWGIRMISGVAAPRFRPFFAHFPPSLARSLRLGARKPGSAKTTAKERREKGQKRGRNRRI